MRLTFAGKAALLLVGAVLAIVNGEPAHLGHRPTATAELSAPAVAAEASPPPSRPFSWSCWPLM
jgi:hypothetical protein